MSSTLLVRADHDSSLPQADKILALTSAANVEIEPIWASLLAKALEGKDVKELLSNVGAGGGAPAVGAVPAAAGGGGAPAAVEAPKEEEKKEEKEESDDDMVRASSPGVRVVCVTDLSALVCRASGCSIELPVILLAILFALYPHSSHTYTVHQSKLFGLVGPCTRINCCGE